MTDDALRTRVAEALDENPDIGGDATKRIVDDRRHRVIELWAEVKAKRLGIVNSVDPSPETVVEICEREFDAPGGSYMPRWELVAAVVFADASSRALAVERDVHLFLLHPSAELWARIASFTRDPPPIVRRDEDATAALPQNPLLASWGQDAREMQLVLAGGPDDVVHDHVAVGEGRPTLLGRIQADVRADRAPPGLPLPGARDERVLLEPNDRSLQVHACHGRVRQVDVVRGAILHLLDDDPTLEPRDIIVMCPISASIVEASTQPIPGTVSKSGT